MGNAEGMSGPLVTLINNPICVSCGREFLCGEEMYKRVVKGKIEENWRKSKDCIHIHNGDNDGGYRGG